MPGFRRLAFSYALNDLGDMVGLVALAVLVLDQTGSAASTTALFIAGRFVPAFLAPVLTARLDRSPSHRVLAGLYALEALAFGGLAVLATDFVLSGVLALALVDGVLALTARGITRGATASALTAAGLLREGNAIINVVFSVTSVAGPVIGGILAGSAGVTTALAADAVSFGLIAVVLGVRPLPLLEHDGATGWLTRLRGGLHEATGSGVGRLIAVQALAVAFFTLITPIEVIYAKRTLHAGTLGFGALLGAWGLGMLLGSVQFARRRDAPMSVLLGVSTAAIGFGYLGMAAAPGIVTACAASVVGGVGNGVQWIAFLTAVQERIAAGMQARIGGLIESVNAAVPGGGYVVGWALTAASSARLAFLVAGVGVMLLVPMFARAGRPEP